MSIDCRTRRHRDRKVLSRDEVFDTLIPEAIERNTEHVSPTYKIASQAPVRAPRQANS